MNGDISTIPSEELVQDLIEAAKDEIICEIFTKNCTMADNDISVPTIMDRMLDDKVQVKVISDELLRRLND